MKHLKSLSSVPAMMETDGDGDLLDRVFGFVLEILEQVGKDKSPTFES